MVNRLVLLGEKLATAVFLMRFKVVPLQPGSALVTPLRLERDGLYRLDILLTTYQRAFSAGEGYLSLHLYPLNSSLPLRESSVSLEGITDNQSLAFTFEPLRDCKGKTLLLSLALGSHTGFSTTIGVCCTSTSRTEKEWSLYNSTRVKAKPIYIPFFEVGETRETVTPLVSIIIVNYNGMRYIRECLASVLSQQYPDYEVIVVDNASSDGSREFICDNYPTIKVLCMPQNVEFVKANNFGLQEAKGEYILLLNPDVWVPPDFLAKMVSTIQGASDTAVAAVACTIDTLGSLMRYAPVFFSVRGLIEGNPIAIGKPVYCLAPCGAAAMYRRNAIEVLGEFLDEEFVSDWEDHDLGYRLNLAGFRCIHAPTIQVKHIGSAAYGITIKRQIRIYRNMLLTYFKNMEWKNFLKAFLITMLSTKPIFSFAGIISFVAKLATSRTMWQKRRAIQKHRKLSDREIQLFTGWQIRWKSDT